MRTPEPTSAIGLQVNPLPQSQAGSFCFPFPILLWRGLILCNFLQAEPQCVILVGVATLAHLRVLTLVFDTSYSSSHQAVSWAQNLLLCVSVSSYLAPGWAHRKCLINTEQRKEGLRPVGGSAIVAGQKRSRGPLSSSLGGQVAWLRASNGVPVMFWDHVSQVWAEESGCPGIAPWATSHRS